MRSGGMPPFEETPRHVLDRWAFCTFTDYPREKRFEADEFAAEPARPGMHRTERFGVMMFVGAAMNR
jgi:hypothetical protein